MHFWKYRSQTFNVFPNTENSSINQNCYELFKTDRTHRVEWSNPRCYPSTAFSSKCGLFEQTGARPLWRWHKGLYASSGSRRVCLCSWFPLQTHHRSRTPQSICCSRPVRGTLAPTSHSLADRKMTRSDRDRALPGVLGSASWCKWLVRKCFKLYTGMQKLVYCFVYPVYVIHVYDVGSNLERVCFSAFQICLLMALLLGMVHPLVNRTQNKTSSLIGSTSCKTTVKTLISMLRALHVKLKNQSILTKPRVSLMNIPGEKKLINKFLFCDFWITIFE